MYLDPFNFLMLEATKLACMRKICQINGTNILLIYVIQSYINPVYCGFVLAREGVVPVLRVSGEPSEPSKSLIRLEWETSSGSKLLPL